MNNLILNESVQPYKAFAGRNTEQMPLLIKEGRVPISVAGLMQRRIDVLNSNAPKELQDSWWNNYFDTGDAPAYDTHSNMKVVLDAQPLRELTPKSKLHNGVLVLPKGSYASLQGEEFTGEQREQYTGKWLTQGQSVDNPIWVALVRGDKTLLKEYDTATFARAKEFGYDTAMGIFPASAQDKESMRRWCLGSINYDQSLASGISSLGSIDGRLVGVQSSGATCTRSSSSFVAPEAQVARTQENQRFSGPQNSERVFRETAPSNGSIVAPTLEQVLALGREHVSKAGMSTFEVEARKLYQ